jgi:hypothetical protein
MFLSIFNKVNSANGAYLQVPSGKRLDFLSGSTFNVGGQFTPSGAIKHHVHSTTGDYAYQLRTESNSATGNFFGMDCEVHQLIDRTAGGVRGISICGRLTASKTISGSANLIPFYGVLDIDGTLNSTGIFATGYLGVDAGGTFTAVSHLTSLWLNSAQEGTVNGEHELLYMSNNGASVMDQAIYVYAGNKITNLFTINTATGMVSDATTADYTFTKTRKVKVNVGGETGYLVVDII